MPGRTSYPFPTIFLNSFLFIFLFSFISTSRAQQANSFLQEFRIRCDTVTYSSQVQTLKSGDHNVTWFRTNDPREVCEVQFRVDKASGIRKLRMKPSRRFRIIDSLAQHGDDTWQGKIRFNDLMASGTESITVMAWTASGFAGEAETFLLPSIEPIPAAPNGVIELMQDEEKIIEIPMRNAFAIKPETDWMSGKGMDYKLSTSVNSILVTVKSHTSGNQQLQLFLHTLKPFVNGQQLLSTELPPFILNFSIRPFRLNYLNTDRNIVYLDQGPGHTEQIQLDYNKGVEMNKTYRLEDRKEPGAMLVGEIFTQSLVENNGKIICRLRSYTRHTSSDGYLFLKDGDKAVFMTNFNIVDKPLVRSIQIRHEGGDWEQDNKVYPGETVELRMEGQGLLLAHPDFEYCFESTLDSSRSSDDIIFLSLKVPANISARKCALFLNRKVTSYELNVSEYQRPHPLDFVHVSYGGGNEITLDNDAQGRPVFAEKVIPDVLFHFDADAIDAPGNLYGKQYLSMRVEMLNSNEELIEEEEFSVCVCPGASSPRHLYYDRKSCQEGSLSLNEHLRHKTYLMDPYAELIITVKHNESHYKEGEGYERKIKLFVKRKYRFDLQISFPTGLLYKTFAESGIGSLSGLSICALAQLNFYDENKPGKFKPYSIGAGFISLNTFNFNQGPDDRRDVGLIVAGTIIPYKKKSKFSFPFYAGTGYLLKAERPFIMFGPGVQVDF